MRALPSALLACLSVLVAPADAGGAFAGGARLVFNAYLPRGGDALADDTDRFPSEYLDELALSGMTGIVIPVSFRQIASTTITPRAPDGDLRIARLRRAARKCAQHGIRLWMYGNEPARFKPGDPLLKEHPELGGAFFPTHGSTMWCPCRPEVRAYIEEAVRDVFSEVPELGGLLNIAYGEGLTTCLDALECCPIEKYWSRPCERCAKRPVWLGYREMSESIVRGIRSAGSKARYISWFYQPMATPERAPWVAECAAHAPEGATFMFNFETGTVLEQMGKMRCSGDYSLALPGPGRPFAGVAEAANKAGVRLGAKIQTASSHELATIPDVPVPGLLYRKYAAMAACGVKDVVQGWSMGGEPGLMLRAAARLSSWDFSRGEDEFLRELALSEWGEAEAETAVALWKGFSDAFSMYPVDHVVQYLGPFHAGMAWNLFARPEAENVLAGWKGFAEDNGDRIGECLGVFTLAEAERISGQMAAAADAPGEAPLERLASAARGNPERLRQVAMMRAFRIHMQSANAVFGFYRRRADAIAASRVRLDAATAMRLLSEMRQIVAAEVVRVKSLIPLARQYDRLGYHPDARCRIYSPESLTRQIVRLERTDADLEAIGRGLAADGPWPESEREKSAAKIAIGSETVSGRVVWRIAVDCGDIVVSGTCKPGCEGLAFVFSDVAGASFPVVCHVPAPGTGDGVFEPRQTAGTCQAEATRLADGGWSFSVRYPQSKWTERGGWRPEWLTVVEDTRPGKRGGVCPLWPENMPKIRRRGDLPWIDGAAFGKIVWPLRTAR